MKKKSTEFLFEYEGDKKVIRKRNVRILSSLILVAVSVVQIIKKEDSSYLGRSYQTLYSENQKRISGEGKENEFKLESAPQPSTARRSAKVGRQKGLLPSLKLIYSAKQVIEREGDPLNSLSKLPSGTNFIGKLLDSYDSRDTSGLLRVQLPYDVRHHKGGFIPKSSILWGQASTSEGEKVFIRFSKVIFPNGEEYKLDAQALSSNDYSPGISGIVQSNADSRMFGSMALTVLSAAADVLTQRGAVSGGAIPSGIVGAPIEANARNAALQGVSQLSKEEAQRSMQKAQSAENFITLESGMDLIISLLSPFSLDGEKNVQ